MLSIGIMKNDIFIKLSEIYCFFNSYDIYTYKLLQVF